MEIKLIEDKEKDKAHIFTKEVMRKTFQTLPIDVADKISPRDLVKILYASLYPSTIDLIRNIDDPIEAAKKYFKLLAEIKEIESNMLSQFLAEKDAKDKDFSEMFFGILISKMQ